MVISCPEFLEFSGRLGSSDFVHRVVADMRRDIERRKPGPLALRRMERGISIFEVQLLTGIRETRLREIERPVSRFGKRHRQAKAQELRKIEIAIALLSGELAVEGFPSAETDTPKRGGDVC